jgi:hypothetical protein
MILMKKLGSLPKKIGTINVGAGFTTIFWVAKVRYATLRERFANANATTSAPTQVSRLPGDILLHQIEDYGVGFLPHNRTFLVTTLTSFSPLI